MIMDYTEELTAWKSAPRGDHQDQDRGQEGRENRRAPPRFSIRQRRLCVDEAAGYLIGASTCAGPYKIENCLIEERMVYTNKIPCGHMRAPGDPQGFFRQ
jgi:CO/xanthine dehydrogenase Mo-binding subunit